MAELREVDESEFEDDSNIQLLLGLMDSSLGKKALSLMMLQEQEIQKFAFDRNQYLKSQCKT